jgi:predicted flavoprotein YhiN
MFGCPYSIKRKYLVDISSVFAGLNFRQAIFASPYKDWEAPTGGYLLTACLASGRVAAAGVRRWLGFASPP